MFDFGSTFSSNLSARLLLKNHILVCDTNSIFICIHVKISLILLLFLQILFCRFLENGNRYRVGISSEH